MEYSSFTFPNGIRLVHKAVNSEVAHFGIIFNTGSRDELEAEHGMAHFIEHAIFKGTLKRKAYHILTRLEHVGGDLNAYTSKEETFIHASFMNHYYPRTIELFHDILFNSVFPEKEIRKEAEVILDEIQSYKDNPFEEIFDEFEGLVFAGHPLGRNILGSPEKVTNYGRTDILEFMQKNYHTDQMVICSVGKISFENLRRRVERLFGGLPSRISKEKRLPFSQYRPDYMTLEKNTFQTHLMTGGVAVSLFDHSRVTMALLNNILGGPGMNSRLNLSLRERHGLAYNIESVYTPFVDTGFLGIYVGTDDQYLEKTIGLINKELALLRQVKLGPLQLKLAKQQLIGQIAISLESNLNELLSMGKSFLVYNKTDTLPEISRKIEAVTSMQILELANRLLEPSALCTLIYKSK